MKPKNLNRKKEILKKGKEEIMKNQEYQSDINETDESSKIKKTNGVNLLDFAEAEVSTAPIEIVKLGSDETAIIAFTLDAETSTVHYCQEDEIKGYVHCNGPGCILCKIGKRKVTKIFLPV